MKAGWKRAFVALVPGLAALGFLAAATAVEVPGGKNPASDCYARLDVEGSLLATSPPSVECTDGDPSCDSDEASNGTCQFILRLCLNRQGVAGCVPPAPPSALTKVKPKGILKRLGLQVPDLASTTCGASLQNVPVKLKRKGQRPGRRKVVVVTKGPDQPKSDVDQVFLVCNPCVGTCPPTTSTTRPPTTSTTASTTTTATASTTTRPTTTTTTVTTTSTTTSTSETTSTTTTTTTGTTSSTVETSTTTTGTTTTTMEVTIQCCVPTSAGGAFDMCILATSSQCAKSGGLDAGPGPCDPNPCPPPSTTTTTTEESTTTTETVTTSSSTTSTTSPCCGAARVVTETGAGRLAVGTFPAFPFPAGVQTTIDIDAGDATCKHNVLIGTGNFTVPVFCSVAALNISTSVTPQGCESGGNDGTGMVWDAAHTCPDADVDTKADSDDGTCDATGGACNTAGIGGNTLGDIDTTLGDTACDAAGVATQLAIPVRSLSWQDGDPNIDCPDEDGMYDAGTDLFVSDFSFILRPTTASSNARFVDKNADGCSFAGGGPASLRACSNDTARPCAVNGDCVAPGTCVTNKLQGAPPAGPCCVAGQTSTVVASGAAMSGGAPLFDLLFGNSSPTTINSCGENAATGSCVLSSDPCDF